MEIIAIICCRGGSKGIPGKNVKKFCGKPLLGWIIDAAQKSGVFDRILLSTDSQEIAEVGEFYGATIPELRPAELATDTANQFDTHAYIFNKLMIRDGTHFVCNLNNNPFISSEIIRAGYEKAKSNGFNRVVLDTFRLGGDYLYFRQCFQVGDRMRCQFPRDFSASQINRQTVGPTYTAINNMRWGKPSHLYSYENFKNEIVINGFLDVELPKMRNFDLDDLDDWDIAEAVMMQLIARFGKAEGNREQD